MKTKRKKILLPTIRTRDEAEALVNQYALIKTNEAKMKAEMDAEILAVQNRYASNLAYCADQANTAAGILYAWSLAHPAEFKNAKSIKFAAGTIGFRTGTPKIALLNRKWTWETVLKKLIEFGTDFIRTKEEVDKDAILAKHASNETCDAELASFGVKVTQDESFYVEPDLTPIKPRQTVTDNTPKQ